MGHIDNFELYAMEAFDASCNRGNENIWVWSVLIASNVYDHPDLYKDWSGDDFRKVVDEAISARTYMDKNCLAQQVFQAARFYDIDSNWLLDQPPELLQKFGDDSPEKVYSSVCSYAEKMLKKIIGSRAFDFSYRYLTNLYNRSLSDSNKDDAIPETRSLKDSFRSCLAPADQDGQELPKDYFESKLEIIPSEDRLDNIRFSRSDDPNVVAALQPVGSDLAEMLKLRYPLWLKDVAVDGNRIRFRLRYSKTTFLDDGTRATCLVDA